MKSVIKILMVILLLSHPLAFAHTKLQSTMPDNGAKLTSSPSEIVLVYSADVRLAKITLNQLNGEKVNIEFKPSALAVAKYTIPLPALPPGYYQASWTAIGGDTHKIEGAFSFSVLGVDK